MSNYIEKLYNSYTTEKLRQQIATCNAALAIPNAHPRLYFDATMKLGIATHILELREQALKKKEWVW
jgi:hypothetical protein